MYTYYSIQVTKYDIILFLLLRIILTNFISYKLMLPEILLAK